MIKIAQSLSARSGGSQKEMTVSRVVKLDNMVKSKSQEVVVLVEAQI